MQQAVHALPRSYDIEAAGLAAALGARPYYGAHCPSDPRPRAPSGAARIAAPFGTPGPGSATFGAAALHPVLRVVECGREINAARDGHASVLPRRRRVRSCRIASHWAATACSRSSRAVQDAVGLTNRPVTPQRRRRPPSNPLSICPHTHSPHFSIPISPLDPQPAGANGAVVAAARPSCSTRSRAAVSAP